MFMGRDEIIALYQNRLLAGIKNPNIIKVDGLVINVEEIEREHTVKYWLTLTKCSNIYENLYISEIDEIGQHAFSDCDIEKIVLKDVKVINSEAFIRCDNLVYIEGDSVESIFHSAFQWCSNLEKIIFPKVSSIAERAFYGCISLKKVNLPGLRKLGSHAFASCYGLKECQFSGLYTVGKSCFENCYNLKTIHIPLVSKIDASAFFTCTSLTCFDAPLLKYCAVRAFEKCVSLKTCNLGTVTRVTSTTFRDCVSLKKIYAPYCTEMLDVDTVKSLKHLNEMHIGLYSCDEALGSRNPVGAVSYRSKNLVIYFHCDGYSVKRISEYREHINRFLCNHQGKMVLPEVQIVSG